LYNIHMDYEAGRVNRPNLPPSEFEVVTTGLVNTLNGMFERKGGGIIWWHRAADRLIPYMEDGGGIPLESYDEDMPPSTEVVLGSEAPQDNVRASRFTDGRVSILAHPRYTTTGVVTRMDAPNTFRLVTARTIVDMDSIGYVRQDTDLRDLHVITTAGVDLVRTLGYVDILNLLDYSVPLQSGIGMTGKLTVAKGYIGSVSFLSPYRYRHTTMAEQQAEADRMRASTVKIARYMQTAIDTLGMNKRQVARYMRGSMASIPQSPSERRRRILSRGRVPRAILPPPPSE
jgi:hypothetical protein